MKVALVFDGLVIGSYPDGLVIPPEELHRLASTFPAKYGWYTLNVISNAITRQFDVPRTDLDPCISQWLLKHGYDTHPA